MGRRPNPNTTPEALAKQREANRRHRERVRAGTVKTHTKQESKATAVLRAKEGGCAYCTEREPVCLDFHHLDPSTKSFEIGQWGAKRHTLADVLAEIAKCVLVCANCHRKLHAGLL